RPIWQCRRADAGSGAYEGQQWCEILRVRRTHGRQVSRPDFMRRQACVRTPAEGGSAARRQEDVSHGPGSAPVAVREWVDPCQPVVESRGLLIHRIGAELLPRGGGVEQLAQLDAKVHTETGKLVTVPPKGVRPETFVRPP